ncbi:hypothetical protein C8T65DRAFT_738845 [Cerioporus squamosus]|nr:hypothetical protein C8T65DRAFT_738845 [Cerioporus squamosus]
MVVLSSRFTVLAALSSIAAVTVLPPSASAAAVAIREPSEVQTTLTARHSRKEGVIHDVTTTSHDAQGDGDSQDSSKGHDPSRHQKTSTASAKTRKPTPTMPLPAAMSKHGYKKLSSSEEDVDDGGASGSKKHAAKEARDVWAVDPVARMRSLWMNTRGVSVHKVDTLPPRVDRRRHHHHHHHDDHTDVVVTGDDDRIHMDERSLGAASLVSRDPHHHDHHNHHNRPKVDVSGNDDNVNLHRRYPPPHRRHGHPAGATGHRERAPTRREPAPEPHYHHHHNDDHHHRVVVNGDNDNVNIHRRQPGARSPATVISGNRGTIYRVEPEHSRPPRRALQANIHVKRDDQGTGAPGTIDIMSPSDDAPQGKRIASLVVASPDGSTSPDDDNASSFMLNASEADHSPMYLVKLASNATDPPTPSNSSSDSTGTPNNSTASSAYIPVMLMTDVFVADSAQLERYCATFDPRPSAPSAMTAQNCSSGDAHKSQIFAYEPGTGIVRPMWFDGEDDGEDSRTDGSDPGASRNSTVADGGDVYPSSPAGGSDTNVTTLSQEALSDDFGEATRRPPTRFALPKTFTAEALDNTQNVTMRFTPMAPEVKIHQSTVQDGDPSASDTITPSSSPASSMSSTTVDSSSSPTSSATDSLTSLSSSLAISSGASDTSTVMATATASTDGSMSTASATVMPGSMTAPSSATTTTDPSSTTSADTSDTFNGSDLIAAATPSAPPALEVKVFNPYASTSASDTATSSPSAADASSLAAGSSVAATDTSSLTSTSSSVAATDASTFTATSSSVSATMTPVSTAPYEWMFKQRSLSDLD